MKKILSIFITLCMILSLVFSTGVSVFAGEEGAIPAADRIEGSAILHCFNWSYNAIKERLPEIAAAGYTAVQTSPVQQPKDYDPSYTDSAGQWWKLYQPLGLSIAPDGTSWLGGADELRALCEEADNYGIKVVVDIVANHLANGGVSGGTYANLSPDVEDDLKNPDYYHTSSAGVGDGSRYEMTQNQMGMPDLNTANSYIQQRVLGLLKDCVNLGVDGFRFDAAKHIELPTDSGCGSDFWPVVIDGVRSYAEKTYGTEIWCYGEILYTAGTDITNYTQYIDVTDSVSSGEVRGGASSANAGQLADGRYQMGEAPDDAVLWVESHDTYEDGSSSGIPDEKIVRGWAIVGARASSTALYLARPSATMGEAADGAWSSTAVAEVNKFKTHFAGTSEYISFQQDNAVTYVERGNGGVVISKLNGAGSVALTAHQMADGVYTDRVSGNTFTVSDGVISGTVGSSGVAVVYDPEAQPEDASAPYYLFGYINGANYGCEEDWENLGDYKFVGGKLTARFTQDSYVGVKSGDNSSWYMTDGWQGQVSSAALYNSDSLGSDANKLFVPADTKVTFTLTPGENDTFTLSYVEAPADYYLFGYINGANYGCEDDWENLGAYKFVDGKLTARFSQDSYVGVKDEYNESWYMTDGWLGEVSSATLCNTTNLGTDANKLFVPADTKVTFTLTPGENDTFTLSYVEAPADYYLFGYINGANYGCEDDWQILGVYKFVDGKLTARFTQDSYVGVKDEYNESWYMTDGWLGEVSSATLCNTTNLGSDANKLFVPADTDVTFTLTPGENDTFTLSYEAASALLLGDLTEDGTLAIADVSALLDLLAVGSFSTVADVDVSGTVNIDDVSALLDILAHA